MKPNTHLGISEKLCGRVESIEEGTATVALTTTSTMAADDEGLVHGGFVFGAVDYAAMLAVNDPNVVLGSADVRFVAPVKVDDEVLCVATVTETKGKKRVLEVTATVSDGLVLRGTMVAFVLDDHVLANR